jgi:hypothetical protein
VTFSKDLAVFFSSTLLGRENHFVDFFQNNNKLIHYSRQIVMGQIALALCSLVLLSVLQDKMAWLAFSAIPILPLSSTKSSTKKG